MVTRLALFDGGSWEVLALQTSQVGDQIYLFIDSLKVIN
jgi:hypothetical protein